MALLHIQMYFTLDLIMLSYRLLFLSNYVKEYFNGSSHINHVDIFLAIRKHSTRHRLSRLDESDICRQTSSFYNLCFVKTWLLMVLRLTGLGLWRHWIYWEVTVENSVTLTNPSPRKGLKKNQTKLKIYFFRIYRVLVISWDLSPLK